MELVEDTTGLLHGLERLGKLAQRFDRADPEPGWPGVFHRAGRVLAAAVELSGPGLIHDRPPAAFQRREGGPQWARLLPVGAVWS